MKRFIAPESVDSRLHFFPLASPRRSASSQEPAMVRSRPAFTLIEVLLVIILMALLAAVILPQFADSTSDAKLSSSVYNLTTLRSQIELYRVEHDGLLPSGTLAEMVNATNAQGETGSGSQYNLGPYLQEVPPNSLTNSDTVTVITNSPAEAGDVTGTGGWLYNATTGDVWIDHEEHYTE